MDAKKFDQIINDELDAIREKIVAKNSVEYAPLEKEVSRFHNFETAAALNGETIEKTLWGFVSKHIASVADMVKDDPTTHSVEKWDEKITDITIYMLILKAMIIGEHEIKQETIGVEAQRRAPSILLHTMNPE
ncbi:hypothetical protein SEA_ARTORIAS_53 [Gordonia phage Artorias]|nr:hypothetical protein SEA_ARTORIAS_53 [Gordonia phage Artorias]